MLQSPPEVEGMATVTVEHLYEKHIRLLSARERLLLVAIIARELADELSDIDGVEAGGRVDGTEDRVVVEERACCRG